MLETTLPPLRGVLGGADPRAARWQRGLGQLFLSEGCLALADELARIPADLEPEARQDLALLVLMLLAEHGRGSTFLPLDDPAVTGAYLTALEGSAAPPWERLRALVDRPGLEGVFQGPLVVEGPRLLSRRYARSEAALAEVILGRIKPPTALPVLEGRLLRCPNPLTEDQIAAVQVAMSRSLALITGGPGTGKTTIVVAMLRAWVHAGRDLDDLLLAAPTGKAAQRMGQAIRKGLTEINDRDELDDLLLERLRPPQTLHLLLGWHPGQASFLHHEGNLLSAKVVIVDEASMISQELMEGLFAALDEKTALVLLGDPDQLPSVDAGQVFRDMVAALPPGTRSHLEHSHRMGAGGHLLEVARAVNRGDLEALREGPHAPALRDTVAAVLGEGVEHLVPTPAHLKAFLERWFRDQVWKLPEDAGDLDTILFPPLEAPAPGAPWQGVELTRIAAVTDAFNRSKILCPVNSGPDGMSVDALNDALHALALEKARHRLAGTPDLIAGEPVLVLHNDYRRELFNGDQGVVMLVRRGETTRPEVFFPRGEGYVSFPLGVLRDQLTLCYAMTVHKAQGSEYDRVALVVPDLEGEFLTRGILYTALTRSRKVVTLLASQETWEKGVRREARRFSRLGQLLSVPAAGEA